MGSSSTSSELHFDSFPDFTVLSSSDEQGSALEGGPEESELCDFASVSKESVDSCMEFASLPLAAET